MVCIGNLLERILTELSGVDLFVADLKAMEAYAYYLYYLAKLWTKPLPEVYDPEDVADYFTCRPHVVALRLLEVVKLIQRSELVFHLYVMSSK